MNDDCPAENDDDDYDDDGGGGTSVNPNVRLKTFSHFPPCHLGRPFPLHLRRSACDH